jgi:DNA-binding NarL/FixJ family response regulator
VGEFERPPRWSLEHNGTMTRARVLLADGHVLIAQALQRLLPAEFDVVGTVADGRASLQAAQDLLPDVVVVDIGMPLLDGVDAGQQVKALLPAIRVGAEGKSMKKVAAVLISPRTVEFRKYRIMELLRVRTNAELVQQAIRLRLIVPWELFTRFAISQVCCS